jgi:hypothetical protein
LASLLERLYTVFRNVEQVLKLAMEGGVVGDDQSQRHFRRGVDMPLILERIVIEPQKELK